MTSIGERSIPIRPRTVGENFEQPFRNGSLLLALEPQTGVLRAPLPRLVPIAIAVPREVQTRTRPELDEVECLCSGLLGDP